MKYEVWVPRFYYRGQIVWGWVPYNRLNPLHWFMCKRPVRL